MSLEWTKADVLKEARKLADAHNLVLLDDLATAFGLTPARRVGKSPQRKKEVAHFNECVLALQGEQMFKLSNHSEYIFVEPLPKIKEDTLIRIMCEERVDGAPRDALYAIAPFRNVMKICGFRHLDAMIRIKRELESGAPLSLAHNLGTRWALQIERR